jgi:hypothetical protein
MFHQNHPYKCTTFGMQRKVLGRTQEKPALWAQILEANDASDYEVEHFVDAPALDESPAEAPAAETAAAEDTDGKDKVAGTEAAKSFNGARGLLQGYDMAKR